MGVVMKKIALSFAVIMLCAAALTAQKTTQPKLDESKWSSVTYFNVPLYKVLQTEDAYVVIYAKNKVGAGSTTIPKKWAKGNTENPRKLKFRTVRGTLKPFMTVVKDGGKFVRVILSVPPTKDTDFWGIADPDKVTDIDKDTLEELDLN
ncbi:hypothetical protein [Treponema sp. Marseille-Q4130]|uniref:hypothetical protein n=1 Tax=Treponema sp. Marseille-Q4130 TaxID=2766702 RepID=UPI001652449D|nr:hypothetical protein [Treponema sp. Marseille-Q4130]